MQSFDKIHIVVSEEMRYYSVAEIFKYLTSKSTAHHAFLLFSLLPKYSVTLKREIRFDSVV